MIKNLGYQVIEDGGGNVYLAVFKGDKVVFFADGYEVNDTLPGDLEVLRDKESVCGWEVQYDNPQEAYDGLTEHEAGWTVIADEKGVYIERMGKGGLNAMWPKGYVYRNAHAVLGLTLKQTENLDWTHMFPIVDENDIIIAVVDSEPHFYAGYVDLNDYECDEWDGIYRLKG